MKRSPHPGFTLVEIMIVVVIIGLLAAMAIPAFQRINWASREKIMVNNARQLSGAADQYFLEYGGNTVDRSMLIGPTNYIKALNNVGAEIYPAVLTSGVTITIEGAGIGRTITYAP